MSQARLLFVADDGLNVGSGHYWRTEALKSVMIRQCGQVETVILDGRDEAIESLSDDGYDGVIFDLERGCPTSKMLEIFRCRKIAFVGAGYKAEGIENLDLAIVQGIPDPPVIATNCLSGLEYVVLREGFHAYEPPHEGYNTFFICGGAADPFDFTASVIDQLEAIYIHTLQKQQVQVLLGNYYRGSVTESRYPFVTIHCNHTAPWEIMRRCNAAIVSYGMTALECLACGLPTFCQSMSEDHERSAQAIEKVCRALWSNGKIGDDINTWLSAWLEWMSYPEICEELRQTAIAAVDGQGARRVADAIRRVIDG